MTNPAALPSAANVPAASSAPAAAVGWSARGALAVAVIVGAALAGGCYEERIISSTGPGSERDVIQSPQQQDYWIDNQIFGPRQSTTNREPVTTRGSR